MKFKLEIALDNDAFYPNYEYELSRQLRRIADKIQQGEEDFLIYDFNGNNVGKAEVILDD